MNDRMGNSVVLVSYSVRNMLRTLKVTKPSTSVGRLNYRTIISLNSRGNSAAAENNIAPSSSGFQASSGAAGGETVPDGAVNGDDLDDPVDERLLIDRMNVEGSYAFQVGVI